jgi:hypothetical protein
MTNFSAFNILQFEKSSRSAASFVTAVCGSVQRLEEFGYESACPERKRR